MNLFYNIKTVVSGILCLLLTNATIFYAQQKIVDFKGEHYALYTKCGQAITFCEITQQNYTSCGALKNCHGLYVLPGDTFYINIEDKNQAEIISADISFDGYFPSISNYIFKPIDGNCIPQQALEIVIPQFAALGSSFQITAQNVAFVNTPTVNAGTPMPFSIFVGNQQPQFTFALSDFTTCPVIEQVSVQELSKEIFDVHIFPNPAENLLNIQCNENLGNKTLKIEIKDVYGKQILNTTYKSQIDISHLERGMYFICVSCSDKTFVTKKIFRN